MLRTTLPVAALGVALAACGTAGGTRSSRVASTSAASTSAATAPAASAPCGAHAPEVLADAVGRVASGIYAGEISGAETRNDQHQVESFAPLLAALGEGNRASITAAVTSLVYSHTHVVRLRVTRGSTVLADVGGPYILAPVGGPLRLHGRTVGHYVLSVQDDLGYVKLVSRFLGVPLVMRVGSRELPVEGLFSPAPARIPAHGPISFRGSTYEAFAVPARSFPGGPLSVSLLVPLPPSLGTLSCAEIRGRELARAAERISRRFKLTPATLSVYAKLVRTLTGGLLYVRSGSRQLAGSTSPGPARLPSSGSVSYRGQAYRVDSFTVPSSLGRLRVYQLVGS